MHKHILSLKDSDENVNYFRIFQTKSREIKVHKHNCHSKPWNRANRSGTVGLEKVLSNQSKVLNIFLTLTRVETALAGERVYMEESYINYNIFSI